MQLSMDYVIKCHKGFELKSFTAPRASCYMRCNMNWVSGFELKVR